MTTNGELDFDVLVIGGGPAGLAAAVRARWVKGHGAVPLEVGVLESGVAGGLAAWRGIFLTGPGFYLPSEDLVGRLVGDCRHFEIPILAERAVAARRDAEAWNVETASGRTLRAAALIVATGLRPQGREAPRFSRGVYVTYMGYDHLWRLFRQIPRTRGTELPIVVVGNEHTTLLAEVFKDIADESGARFAFLLDENLHASEEAAAGLPGEILRGRYLDVEDGGDDEPLRVAWQASNGDNAVVEASAVIVDYNAFEIRPDFALSGDVGRDARGFVVTDRDGRGNQPFLYAAGDITGGYAMALAALSSGATAAFAAYEDLYRARFGEEPSLFAYKPKRTPVSRDYRALPVWRDGDRIRPLVSAERLGEFRLADEEAARPWLARAGFSWEELRQALGEAAATRALDGWIERKVVTVRRPVGSTGP
jgi:thioredoxin reductase